MNKTLMKREGAVRKFLYMLVFVGIFFVLPTKGAYADFSLFSKVDEQRSYSLVGAKSSNGAISYSEVKLSEINRDISGDLANAKITIPSTGVIDDSGSIYIPETDSSIYVAIITKDKVWLDAKQKFKTFDIETGEEVYVEDLIKNDDLLENQKIKSGKFQGSKKNQMLTISGSSPSEFGVTSSSYIVLIHDQSTDNIITIRFNSSNELKLISDKIWKTVLKSTTDKAKKTDKKTGTSKESGELAEKAYSNQDFSIKFPKGWTVDEDSEGTSAIPNNIGASIVVMGVESEESIDYDPDMIDFWVSIFKDEYRAEIDGFKFKSASNIVVDGVPAIRFNYTARVDGIPIIGSQFFIVRNGREYILTATYINKTQEKKYSSIIEKSFATFKRKNK